MRICHVSPHLPPDQAANALLPAQLGSWAQAAGHDVAYVAYEPAQGSSNLRSPLAGEVVRVVRHRPASRIARTLRTATWRGARDIAAALDQVAATADLIHLHSNGLIVEVAAAWARRQGIPAVLTLYGTEIWHYRRRRLIDPFTRAYSGAARVTFYSQGLMDRAKAVGLDRRGLSVIYPAVPADFSPIDDATRRAWRASLDIAEPLLVLNVKRLHELAGQRFLLDAFARIAAARRDVRLVICGTGPLEDALTQQAATLGIADRVTFTGLVSNAEVARYAAVADLFVLPSLLEALPTVAVEALASGTPVVSADHPGGLELHGLFGEDVQVVPREQVAPLTRAMAALLESPRRTTSATQALVTRLFGPEAIKRQYEDIYDRAIG